jgi:hypothetical protein
MIRSFFSVVVIGVSAFALAPALLQGCSQTGVGDPCVPAREYDQTFLGFDPGEVNLESKSFQCQTRLCLANHFRGRVSCPYGQSKTGAAPATDSSGNPYTDKAGNPIDKCSTPAGSPGNIVPVTGPSGATDLTVPAQCLDRTADKAVYCSCRCANSQGKTDDGAVYCKCPDGFTCAQQLVTPISSSDQLGLTGAYCIKSNTAYDSTTSCQDTGPECDPSKGNCGTWNGQ